MQYAISSVRIGRDSAVLMGTQHLSTNEAELPKEWVSPITVVSLKAKILPRPHFQRQRNGNILFLRPHESE